MKTKKNILSILIFTLFLLGASFLIGMEQTSAAEKTVIYFFWGEGCPHCAVEKPFLEEMEQKYPELEVKMFETWKNLDNAELFQKVAAAYGIQARGVPTTFIGDFEPIVGYADYMADDIEDKIKDCIENSCVNPGVKAGIEEETNTEPTTSSVIPTKESNQEEEIDFQPEQNQDKICLHLFYKEDCPQCSNITNFLQNLEKEYNLTINKHDIGTEEENLLYQTFKDKYGLVTGAYPIIFLGNNYYIGDKAIKDHLEKEIIRCETEACICPLENIKGLTPFLPQSTDITPEKQEKLKLPFVGEIDISSMPLFLTTGIIAFVDGFNPCSLWLIAFLLGIVINSGSRKKIFLVGTTFLLVTTTVYGLFMVGLLNVFLYIGYLRWIQVAVALLALIFALVNIKDYFWYKKGLSFTISDKYKPKIFKDVRGIMKKDKSTWGMMLATAAMALGVVLVELPCTAGFPVIWTNIIAQHHIQGIAFALLLALYLLIYLLDEVVVVGAATLTLKASRFEEKHGRILKLIGGMIMLALALVMFIKPDLMNNISTALLIFAMAIAVSFLLIFIHRKILPKFGIKIGTEENLLTPEASKEGEENNTDEKNNIINKNKE
ncbi:MAG: conjugal transfer protein TraF [Patescibacteria group bacterium]|nr:conjugal transfer protein TraF [Patescibacteria group bacterium]